MGVPAQSLIVVFIPAFILGYLGQKLICITKQKGK